MPFKPLLAATLEVKDFPNLRLPLVASPKLDGIRVIVIDGVVMTRNLKPIRNKYVQTILGHARYNGLDGEIIVGSPTDPLCYRNTNSGVMSGDGQPHFKLFVFDDAEADGEWHSRIGQARSKMDDESLFVEVKHEAINSIEELVAYEEKCLEEGYEGIMLRDPNGRYKQGRSTLKEEILLKLKRFTDFEAVVVGFQERMHNANEAKINALGHTERSMHKENMIGRGDLGALWVIKTKTNFDLPTDPEKRQAVIDLVARAVPCMDTKTALEAYNINCGSHTLFTVGSGFTDAERTEIWNNKEKYLGKQVTLKCFNYGGYDVPRFPTFVGFREDLK